MFKLLLATRYLRTRYIALASIVSVTLGVATMIVVNSVMSGFREEMYNRLHGILSDIVVASHGLDGIDDVNTTVSMIEQVLGDDLAGRQKVKATRCTNRPVFECQFAGFGTGKSGFEKGGFPSRNRKTD